MVSLLFFQLLNGIGLGLIYFLLAIGLSVIFGLLGFVNFAHGAFYAIGAYATYRLLEAGVSFWWALAIAPIVTAAIALVCERLVLRRTYSSGHSTQIIVTFGLALMIQEGLAWAFGTRALNVMAPEALSGFVTLGEFTYPVYRLFVMAVSVALAVLLWLLIERTRFGAIVRASSESREEVMLLGIPVNVVYTAAFSLGIGIAALAGALAAPLRGVDPLMGLEALGLAFVVVVMGGMGSFLGTLVAAVLVGVIQSLMTTLWSEGAYLAIYLAMAAVILFRPYGLIGRH